VGPFFGGRWVRFIPAPKNDKERLYDEVHRVLRPGGCLALHEIMAGPVAPIHFPVPWARHSAISYLSQSEELRAKLASMGFKELNVPKSSAQSQREPHSHRSGSV
jgi:predicted methyltransferase